MTMALQRALKRSAALLLFLVSLISVTNGVDDYNEEERLAVKAWYLRKLRVPFLEDPLPVSPVTICLVAFILMQLYWSFVGDEVPVYCEASHILLQDKTDVGKRKLIKYKSQIGDSLANFQEAAKKYSACPSKQNGGSLGRFGEGQMARPFEKVCFDPKTPLNTTLGPVQTTFGWHLIYIHDRHLPPM